MVSNPKRKLSFSCHTRGIIACKIHSAFSHLNWSKASNREEMDYLWEEWVKSYNALVEDFIGTRWARVSSWGRKYDSEIRKLCVEASIA